MSQGSKDAEKTGGIKLKADQKGVSVEATIPGPEIPSSRWRAAWGLLGSGVIGAVGVLVISTGVGVVAAGVGVAAVAAREIVDGLTVEAPKDETATPVEDNKPTPPSLSA